MSVEKVKEYLKQFGADRRVMEFAESSATVELAAQAIGCEPRQIAKTLSFLVEGKPVLIVAAGDAKVDNKKFKEVFHTKAKMIPFDEVEGYVGHAPGGVCPFVVSKETSVYLDESLKRFERVYPAAGNDHSAVDLSVEELEACVDNSGWIDVCKGWNE